MKRLILYGLLGGMLIALLKVIEYKHFIGAYPAEVYGEPEAAGRQLGTAS